MHYNAFRQFDSLPPHPLERGLLPCNHTLALSLHAWRRPQWRRNLAIMQREAAASLTAALRRAWQSFASSSSATLSESLWLGTRDSRTRRGKVRGRWQWVGARLPPLPSRRQCCRRYSALAAPSKLAPFLYPNTRADFQGIQWKGKRDTPLSVAVIQDAACWPLPTSRAPAGTREGPRRC